MQAIEASVTPFLSKLLSLTSLNSGVPGEVSGWDEEGTTYIIKNGIAFENILRNYFKGTLQTFVRQLHFYGFSKMDLPLLGTNSWCFFHQSFRRDSPELIKEIRRKNGKDNVSSKTLAINNITSSLVANKALSSSLTKKTDVAPARADDISSLPFASPCTTAADVSEEVNGLKDMVRTLQEQVDMLVHMVNTKMKSGNEGLKKRKLETSPESKVLPKVSSLQDLVSTPDFGDLLGDFAGLPLMDQEAPASNSKEEQKDPFNMDFGTTWSPTVLEDPDIFFSMDSTKSVV